MFDRAEDVSGQGQDMYNNDQHLDSTPEKPVLTREEEIKKLLSTRQLLEGRIRELETRWKILGQPERKVSDESAAIRSRADVAVIDARLAELEY